MRAPLPRPASILLLACAAPLVRAGDPVQGGDALPPLPALVSLDPANFDRSVDPCTDIYAFVNGGWMAHNPVPPEYGRWGTGHEVTDRNQRLLREILEAAAQKKDAPRGSVDQLLGDFWCACMDTAAVEKQGLLPISDLIGRIDACASKDELRSVISYETLQGLTPLFNLAPDQAADDATQMILWAHQGGLGLPDRDYYLRDDDRSQSLREDYVGHVAAMFAMLGEEPEKAADDAAIVMDLETRLAQASMDRVMQRDPQAIWNPMPVTVADEQCPGVAWGELLRSVGAGREQRINLAQPDFFAALGSLLESEPLEHWQAFLRWHALHEMAPYLSSAVDHENFDFYGQRLAGTPRQQPRWKRCLQATDQALGMTLGQAYVARAFSPEARQRAQEMVANLQAAMRETLQSVPWMSDATRQQALAKLAAFDEKIGYPDVWRDESAMAIDRHGYAANVLAASAFELRRELGWLGKPVDRHEWKMSPQTVNAYYNPSMNEIVFPAGILQPPFFAASQDDAQNYGAMGAIIGHEITHGFDDSGAQFDKDGNLKDWWTDADLAEFQRRGDVLRKQFDGYVAVDDLHVNGSLTLGENIADLGGLRIAYRAFEKAMEGKPHDKDAQGFTPEQRFFMSYVQAFRANDRPESLRLQVNTNPHAPSRFRAIGPISDLPEFRAAFGCAEGGPLALPADQRAEIW